MARGTNSTATRQKAASKQAAQTPKGGSAQARAELRRLFTKPDKQELRWWFDVGQQALLLHPETEPGAKRAYGTKTIEDFARRLSEDKLKYTTNMLWQARKLALRFKSWKELEKFQGKLSVWHVMTLLSVDEKRGSKRSMDELHDRCVAEGWSVDRLKREVQNDKGNKMASGHSPEPLLPATPAIAVKDLYIAARRWMIYHDKCLTGRRPILKHARRADCDGNLLRDVEKAIQGLEQVEEAVKEELQQLRQMAKNIKTALKG